MPFSSNTSTIFGCSQLQPLVTLHWDQKYYVHHHDSHVAKIGTLSRAGSVKCWKCGTKCGNRSWSCSATASHTVSTQCHPLVGKVNKRRICSGSACFPCMC